MTHSVLVLVGAVALDVVFGDPRWFAHPVRIIGKGIEWIDSSRSQFNVPERVLGWVFALGYPVCVAGILGGGLYFVSLYSPEVYILLSILLLWTCISYRDLWIHASTVLQNLRNGSLEKARTKLGRMVGRDTDRLSKQEVSRACVESVAEGCLDGIVSPLFWYVLGGIPAVFAFKTVSTMDSMIGYRDERYRFFGEGAARLDDVMNWIPARLILLLVPIASWVSGLSGWRAFSVGLRDRLKHTSPNAAHPEAAFAGSLNCRLGGPATYQGRKAPKPFLNERGSNPGRIHISYSLRLLTALTFLSVTCGICIFYV